MATPPPLPTRNAQSAGGPPPLPTRAPKGAYAAPFSYMPQLPSVRDTDTEFDSAAEARTDREGMLGVGMAPINMWVALNSECFNRLMFQPYPRLPNGQPSLNGKLYVEFADTLASGYYAEIPRTMWNDMFRSSSKGTFYNAEIKGKFTYHKGRAGLKGRQRTQKRQPQSAFAKQRTYVRHGKIVMR